MGFSVTARTFGKVGGKGFGTADHNSVNIPNFLAWEYFAGICGKRRENGRNLLTSRAKRSFLPVFALIVKKHLRGFA